MNNIGRSGCKLQSIWKSKFVPKKNQNLARSSWKCQKSTPCLILSGIDPSYAYLDQNLTLAPPLPLVLELHRMKCGQMGPIQRQNSGISDQFRPVLPIQSQKYSIRGHFRGGGICVLWCAIPIETSAKTSFYLVDLPYFKHQGENLP